MPSSYLRRLSLPLSFPQRTVALLRCVLAGCSGILVLLFLQSAYRRIRYPYVLEWIEEGNLQEVARYVHHLPVYIAPSIEYTANIYAPLYFWVSSWFARWMGVSFASMRIVSFISTLGLLCGMAALVWQELPRKSAARALSTVFAVGLFLSLYPISTAFFDLGRVDMLCTIFVIKTIDVPLPPPLRESPQGSRSPHRPARKEGLTAKIEPSATWLALLRSTMQDGSGEELPATPACQSRGLPNRHAA